MTTPETKPEQPATPPEQTPERAAFLVQSVHRIAAVITEQMLRELAGDPASTESHSLTDRLMLRALTPWLPKLRGALLSKLSEASATELERNLSALARSIDELLAAAPGDPLPAMVYRYDGQGLILVPCPTCG